MMAVICAPLTLRRRCRSGKDSSSGAGRARGSRERAEPRAARRRAHLRPPRRADKRARGRARSRARTNRAPWGGFGGSRARPGLDGGSGDGEGHVARRALGAQKHARPPANADVGTRRRVGTNVLWPDGERHVRVVRFPASSVSGREPSAAVAAVPRAAGEVRARVSRPPAPRANAAVAGARIPKIGPRGGCASRRRTADTSDPRCGAPGARTSRREPTARAVERVLARLAVKRRRTKNTAKRATTAREMRRRRGPFYRRHVSRVVRSRAIERDYVVDGVSRSMSLGRLSRAAARRRTRRGPLKRPGKTSTRASSSCAS